MEKLFAKIVAHQDSGLGKSRGVAPPLDKRLPVQRRVIKGHQRKVYCVQWSGDSSRVASGGQEGLVLVTNPINGMKTCSPVRASFVMGTALNTDAKILAHGGMDNKVTITDVATHKPVIKKEFAGHDGYIAALRFVPGNEAQLLTASGDGECWLWEAATGKVISKFIGHTGDCGSLSIVPENPTVVATGSTDQTVRIWDLRSGGCVRTFVAPSEVNACCLFPNGDAVAYATEGGQFGLFDIGSYTKLTEGKTSSKGAGMSVAISGSGRYTYVGFENGAINVCDTFDMTIYEGMAGAHVQNVCSMAMAPDGTALATSGYDGLVKIFAGP